MWILMHGGFDPPIWQMTLLDKETIQQSPVKLWINCLINILKGGVYTWGWDHFFSGPIQMRFQSLLASRPVPSAHQNKVVTRANSPMSNDLDAKNRGHWIKSWREERTEEFPINEQPKTFILCQGWVATKNE